jgi:NADPH:quinone reductase-like Zn-dependent oxidoreductase
MRAARLVEFGASPAFELQEVPDPSPGPGEVSVALRAAALNRRDRWIWRSAGYCPLPVTLGSDGAGVVAAVGDGVEGIAVGQEVVFDPTLGWGEDEETPTPAFDILGAPTDGTFAEQVVVPAANVARKPPALSWEEAAALNLAGLTAWRAMVTCAAAGPGRSVLVTGAGSGVSTFLIQIGAALGARVYVTSSNPEKIARAAALGAEAGVSYEDARWPELLVEAAGGPLDAAVDSYGGETWARAMSTLRPGGVLVSFGDTGDGDATVTVAEVYWSWRRILGTSMGSPREYRALLAHVEGASWRPEIDSVFPLDEIAAAAQRLEAPDRFGKVVLSVN